MICAGHSASEVPQPRAALRCMAAAMLAGLLLGVLLSAGCQFNPAQASRRYLDRGKGYFDKQQYSEAAIEFRNAIKKDPNTWEPHYYLGLAAARQQKWSDAVKELSRAIELRPNYVPAQLALAELELGGGNLTSEARRNLDRALALEPSNPRAHRLLAQLSIVQKDFTRALSECDRATALSPNDSVAWTTCGFAAVGAQQYDRADTYFRRALALDPSPGNYSNLANLARLSNRSSEFLPLLQHAVATHPQSLELKLTLADLLVQAGRLNDVDALFQPLETNAAAYPNLHARLGDFWMSSNQLPRAIRELQMAQAERPQLLVQKKLISAYLTLQQIDRAQRLNQELLQQHPRDTDGQAFQGALAYLQGNYDGATHLLQAVLATERKSLFANYYLGLALMKLNHPEAAKAAFFECVQLDQNFEYAYERLAELALASGDWQSAQQYGRQVLELNPGAADGYTLLAQGLMKQGDWAGAEQVIRAADKSLPPSAALNEVAGQLYTLKKQEKQALSRYQQALALTTEPLALMTRFAEFQIQFGDPRSAADWMRRSLPQASSPAQYQLLIARLLLKSGNLSGAEVACRQALTLNNSSATSHLLLGEILQHRGRSGDALAEYNQTIHLAPNHTLPYAHAAILLTQEGDYASAETYIDSLKRLEPDSVLTKQVEVRWYAERGEDLDTALAIAQSLSRSLPQDANVTDLMGWVYYRKGLYRMALSELRHAAGKVPYNAEVQYHLGMTYSRLREAAPAREALQRALKLGLTSRLATSQAQETLKQLAPS